MLRIDDMQFLRNWWYTRLSAWFGRVSSNPNKNCRKYLFYSAYTKIRQVSTCRIFLSKPQAWHIIAARSAVHIISPFGAVSHHASACILPAAWWYTTLRVDDMQFLAELMIYTPSAWFGRGKRAKPTDKSKLPHLKRSQNCGIICTVRKGGFI